MTNLDLALNAVFAYGLIVILYVILLDIYDLLRQFASKPHNIH